MFPEVKSKAELYKTARFTQKAIDELGNVPTVCVRVKFFAVVWNVFTKRNENVYSVYTSMDDDSFIGTYFESALERFGL